MRAVFYDRQGPASEVLQVGELPDPEPGPGEVRVRLAASGVNPGDTKKRRGWLGSSMAYGRIVPHSDGAGTVDAAGDGVDPGRAGERVWVWGAQSYRPSGTAAEYTVVPAEQAVVLPDAVGIETGAALGIPGITAHRAVFADWPVTGRVVLVQGVRGAVGSVAAQLALWGGARVIGSVVRSSEVDQVDLPGVEVVALDDDPVQRVRAIVPDGVDRIVEVAMSDNADLDSAVLVNGGVIAAYATRADRPELPFWPMLFNNVVLRLLGSDDFPARARTDAARDLTAAAAAGALRIPIAATYPLADTAAAHDAVDAGSRGRVVVRI